MPGPRAPAVRGGVVPRDRRCAMARSFGGGTRRSARPGSRCGRPTRRPRSSRSSKSAATSRCAITSSRSSTSPRRRTRPAAFGLVDVRRATGPRPALFEIARESYPDQPGRSEQRIESFEEWRVVGTRSASAGGVLHRARGRTSARLRLPRLRRRGRGGTASPAIARAERGRGVASAIKRATARVGKGARRARAAHGERGRGSSGMLAINRRLGYRPLYTEIVLRGPAA